MARVSTLCSPPGSGHARWTCQKLGKASAAVQNQILGFYTPAHWIAFLKTFALAARLRRGQGQHVSQRR